MLQRSPMGDKPRPRRSQYMFFLWTAVAVVHDEGRLLDRVVADCDDQIGAVDGLVHVVAL